MNPSGTASRGVRASAVVRLAALVAIALLTASGAVAQSVAFKTITGDPLKINIGSDTAFQVFNSAVPGSGQVYPSSCQNVADMGLFVNVDGALVAPDFRNHGCSTATGSIGANTPWVGTVSDVSGDGSTSSPFTVTVNASAGGISVSMVVTYVNGNNFFRLNSSYSASATHVVRAYLGADIFLASSDAGVYFLEPTLHAPGGRDCAIPPTYTILLIPITPADRVSATAYATVWSEIGQNQLDNTVAPSGCIDNGAGLQWNDIFHGGTTAQIQSAVSFGDIPPASAFTGPQAFQVSIDPSATAASAGETLTFTVTTSHLDPDFKNPLALSLANFPDTMTASLDKTNIDAPGDGTATLTVKLSPDIFPSLYSGLAVLATEVGVDSPRTYGATTSINVWCDPPMVLGTSQPKSQTVARGSNVKLTVTADVGQPVHYQWYRGHSGTTFSPMTNENGPSVTVGPVNDVQEYWVRITNGCGTVDSDTAVVRPSS